MRFRSNQYHPRSRQITAAGAAKKLCKHPVSIRKPCTNCSFRYPPVVQAVLDLSALEAGLELSVADGGVEQAQVVPRPTLETRMFAMHALLLHA